VIGKISCDVCTNPIDLKNLVIVAVESGSTKGANGDLIVRKSVHLCSKECAASALREMLLGFESHRIACVDQGLHRWVGDTCTRCGTKFPVNEVRRQETPEWAKLDNTPKPANGATASAGAHPFDADEAPKKRGPKKVKPPDPKQNDFVVPSDGAEAKASAQRTGDQSIKEPPTWCGTCGEPRFFERRGAEGVWKCKNGHEGGETLPVKEGLPGENLSSLAYQLEARGVKVTLPALAQWPVMRREVARLWIEQPGMDLPEWLAELRSGAQVAASPVMPVTPVKRKEERNLPPPGPDVPDVDLCLKLGISPTDPGAPTYGSPERRPTPAIPEFTFD